MPAQQTEMIAPAQLSFSSQPFSALPPPSIVLQQMPQGAKSCFAGSINLTTIRQSLFVHLYNKNPTEELKSVRQETQYHFTVDIFEAIEVQGQKSYSLLNSFPLNYTGTPWPPTSFKAQALWLDPRQKRKPIIKFDCFSKGLYGTAGENVLAIFLDGLAHQPTIQSLEFGTWRSSSTLGQDNKFDSVDKSGLLQIRAQVFLATSEIPKQPPVILRWNGKEFATTSENGNRMLNGSFPILEKLP